MVLQLSDDLELKGTIQIVIIQFISRRTFRSHLFQYFEPSNLDTTRKSTKFKVCKLFSGAPESIMGQFNNLFRTKQETFGLEPK